MKHILTGLVLTAFFSAAIHAEQAIAKTYALFNDKDLTGWKGEGYLVEDGAITCTPAGKNLVTERTFANYVLHFDFKLTPGANNGLGIHYPGHGDGAYTGMELQVLDNTAPKYKDLKPTQFHGSLYTMQAAKKAPLKPAGEWNKQRVLVNGPQLKVDLNGATILEANLDEMAKQHPEHQGVKNRSGHIAFLGHGDKVSYKNIRIAELPPLANHAAVKSNGFTNLIKPGFEGWKHDPAATNWTEINGIIKHDGKGGAIKDLWSEKSYKDLVLVFDWRWSGRGPKKQQPVVKPDGSEDGNVEVEELDSGIYLRGNTKSQVNLWNWSVGSGEVYGYRKDGKMSPEVKAGVTPKAKADKPLGEWNRTMITLKGDRLSVKLNGQDVITNAQLPGIPAEGPIGLQHHGAAIDFANIWIKEL
ncbi:MAG: DUF1080 domain-containing protein [Verrucomicrobiota bacterium]